MNRITRSVVATLSTTAIAAGVTVALSSPANAEERRCTGSIGAVSVDGDVVVPRGSTCTLVGTRVDGSVKVYGNATLVAKGVRVNGNVQAENFRRVEIKPRTVDGLVKRSTIGGSIQIKQGGGGEIRRTVVNADVQVFSNDRRWAIHNNAIDGNLQCKSNDPKPVGDRNRVGGNKEDQCRRF